MPNSGVVCPNGHPVSLSDAGAKFCRLCGSSLERVCAEGHHSPSTSKFCTTCGAGLGAERTAQGPVAQSGGTRAAGPQAGSPAAPIAGAPSARAGAGWPDRWWRGTDGPAGSLHPTQRRALGAPLGGGAARLEQGGLA